MRRTNSSPARRLPSRTVGRRAGGQPRRASLSPRLETALSYGFALLLGATLVLLTFPADFLFPRAGAAWAPQGDAAQHAIAQRYFIGDAWRWPPLLAANILPPGGLNIAFADGIPRSPWC